MMHDVQFNYSQTGTCEGLGCVLAARPKVGHEKLVFSHALKRQDRSSVLLLSMTRSWI